MSSAIDVQVPKKTLKAVSINGDDHVKHNTNKAKRPFDSIVEDEKGTGLESPSKRIKQNKENIPQDLNANTHNGHDFETGNIPIKQEPMKLEQKLSVQELLTARKAAIDEMQNQDEKKLQQDTINKRQIGKEEKQEQKKEQKRLQQELIAERQAEKEKRQIQIQAQKIVEKQQRQEMMAKLKAENVEKRMQLLEQKREEKRLLQQELIAERQAEKEQKLMQIQAQKIEEQLRQELMAKQQAENEEKRKQLQEQKREEMKRQQELRAKLKIEKEEKLMQLQEQKKEQSFKALKFLLNKSVVYTKFLEDRFETDPANTMSKSKGLEFNKKEIPMKKAASSSESKMVSPVLFENGSLRKYQLEGLEWLKVLFENGVNGILADEMGLGKTVQVIAFICYLYKTKVPGPFLICAPLSTLPNWVSEFERFAPKLPVVLFHGTKESKKEMYADIMRRNIVVDNVPNCGPVVITSFDVPIRESTILARRTWRFIIVDEGHRLKNHNTILYRVLESFHSVNRLLITGTPLQNNLRELWSLLHFLLPDIFNDFAIFESWIDMDELKNNSEKFIKQEQEKQILSMVHSILKPFVLRRMKTDVELNLPPKKEVIVYCPMSVKQRHLYKYVLEKNYEELDPNNPFSIDNLPAKRVTSSRLRVYKEYSSDDDFDDDEEGDSNRFKQTVSKPEKKVLTRITMQNRQMMYRKIVNHPYLIHFPLIPSQSGKEQELLIDEDLILQSGKMMMLDALTARLIATGHKILIFSTLTIMLDIIEDFVLMRDYEYCRLDGKKNLEDRQNSMHRFNTDPNVKIFLISTRAGGLGLNLVAADTVILYDSDWNPQVDLQAQDRCHRIGQTRPVMVYQFVTRGTIDETIVATGEKKRKLEKVIMNADKLKIRAKHMENNDIEYLKQLLSEEERQVVTSVEEVLSPEKLDALLDRSELLEQMRKDKTGEV